VKCRGGMILTQFGYNYVYVFYEACLCLEGIGMFTSLLPLHPGTVSSSLD